MDRQTEEWVDSGLTVACGSKFSLLASTNVSCNSGEKLFKEHDKYNLVIILLFT